MDHVSPMVSNLQRHIDDAGKVYNDIHRAAIKTLLETFDDDPESGALLESKTVAMALNELRRQMTTQNKLLSRPTQTIGATSAVDGTGNGTIVFSDANLSKKELDGDKLKKTNVKGELIRATCIADATNKRISPGSEEFLVQGQRSVPRSSHLWPKGSGLKRIVTVTSPNHDAGYGPGQNILTNSNFEDWTSNIPDNWTLTAGTAGTDIVPTTAYEANGTTGLEFDNNGATCTIRQTLDDAGGSLGRLKPDTAYIVSFSIRELGTVNAGSVSVKFKHSSGTTMNDSDLIRECSFVVAHGSFTDAHVRHSKVLWTPNIIGSGAYIEMSSASMTSGTEVFVDSLVVAEMHRPIPGGIAFAIVPGTTDFVHNDQMTALIANALGASNEGEMARELDRFYNTEAHGIEMPDSLSPNIADTLIS